MSEKAIWELFNNYVNPPDMGLFTKFYLLQFQEYLKHYKERGDSWKEMSIDQAFKLLSDAVNGLEPKNYSHCLDIANFNLFLFYLTKAEKEHGSGVQ